MSYAHPVKFFRKWKPTNGDDSRLMESWCCECERDREFQDGRGDSCEIAARAYVNYGAAQLVLDDEGYFMCTAFVPLGMKIPGIDVRTGDLFD